MRANAKRTPRSSDDRIRDNDARRSARQARIDAGLCHLCTKPRGEHGTAATCRRCADERNEEARTRAAV